MQIDLSNDVVLVGMGSTKIPETIAAIEYCQKQVQFKECILLTDINFDHPHINHVLIRNIPSYKEYQKFVVKESSQVICDRFQNFDGHFLFINWDGFIINPYSWTSEFLQYDYIGAPWPWFKYTVGNGGFALKSKKFLSLQNSIPKDYIVNHNEDVELCLVLRKYFIFNGCKYADAKIGYKFSTEVGDLETNKSFGFHDFKYHPNLKQLINYEKI